MNHRYLLPTLLMGLFISQPLAAEVLPEVRVGDGRFETADGEAVDLRGVNVGNWLLIEPWMLGAAGDGMGAEYAFDQLLISRFGEERHAELKTLWRDNWIKADDFQRIKDFGFNTVRVPFHFQVIEDPDRPGHVAEGGFKYLDDAVHWAAENELYVILDMHAAPGHQSRDGPSGRVGYNRLWKDASAQDRFVSLWSELATHFRDEPNVAAYDLVNEPWGEFNDAHADIYAKTIDRVVKAVRAEDQDTPILVAALLGGNFEPLRPYLDAMPGNGWSGIALTDHYYPGLFGSPPQMLSHARHVASLPAKLKQYEPWGTPLVIGEMQVVFERLEQPRLTRFYFDHYNEIGWAPVLWSWKLVKPEAGVQPDNWYCVTNAEPWSVDLHEDSYEELAEKFKRLGTMKFNADKELRAALRADADDLEPIELPDPEMGVKKPDLAEAPEGWKALAIGDAEEGGIVAGSMKDDAFTLAGTGQDIFSTRDAFTFLARKAKSTEAFTTTLTKFEGAGQWAKAGIMIRDSEAADAPFAFIHAFSDGRVTVASRPEPGASVVEQHLDDEQPGDLPLRFAIRRDGKTVKLGWARGDADWNWVDPPAAVTIDDDAIIGYAVSSNADAFYATVDFTGGLE